MSKLEKKLHEDRQGKVRAAKRKILDQANKAKFEGETNDQGTPVVPTYGLSVNNINKDHG